MTRAFAALAAVIALAGCHDRQTEALTRVKARVCACKDVPCAEAAMKDVPTRDVKSSHRSQVIARDMLDCLATLYEAQRPSTDPDAGSDASAEPGSAASVGSAAPAASVR